MGGNKKDENLLDNKKGEEEFTKEGNSRGERTSLFVQNNFFGIGMI